MSFTVSVAFLYVAGCCQTIGTQKEVYPNMLLAYILLCTLGTNQLSRNGWFHSGFVVEPLFRQLNHSLPILFNSYCNGCRNGVCAFCQVGNGPVSDTFL